MKKTPLQTLDPSILAVIHRAGRTWRGLIASTSNGAATLLSHREFAADQIARLDAWLDEHKAGKVLCVLPSSAVICRNFPLPDASTEQLTQALHLQAEAHLLGIAPPHRMAMAVLPNAPGETTRTGLVLAWPESAAFTAPPTSRDMTFVPDVAALAAILNGQRPDEGLFWIDRHDGSVALAITHSGGAMFRSVREDAQSVDQWALNIGRIAAETALNVGHSGEFVQAVLKDAQCKAGMLQPSQAKLFAPLAVISAAAGRAQRMPTDADWWSDYGIAAGALLAHAGNLAPLTELQDQPKIETPSPIEKVVQRLSNAKTTAAVVAICVLILLCAPLVFAGMRLAVLNVRFGDLSTQLSAARISKKQLAVYEELEKQKAWPMTKLLADIMVNTPIGIELDTVRIEAGNDFNVSGTALANDGKTPAQLVAVFQQNLARDGMFGDIGVTAGKTDNLGRYKFDLSAKVLRPYLRPNLPEELDYAAKPWSVRLYGVRTGDGVASAVPTGSQATFGSNTSAPSETSTASSRTTRLPETDAGSETTDVRADAGERAFVGRSDSGGVGADFSSRDEDVRPSPTAVPPALDVEQLKVMNRAELRDALAKVAGARQNRDLDKETKDRLQEETKLIMEYLRKAPA